MANAPRIEDVVLRFTKQLAYEGAVFQAEVRTAPELLRGAPFEADIGQQLADFRKLFNNRVYTEHRYWETPADADPDAAQGAEHLIELGTQLYALLPPALREGLPRSFQRAFDKGCDVRIVFEAVAGDQADHLLSVPWEILYFSDFKSHLGLMPRVRIVRRLLETVRRSLPLGPPPFRIAHIIAEPAGYEPIDASLQDAEQMAIQQAVGDPALYHLVASPGSVQGLQALLRRQPVQVVHFLGHGVDPDQTEQSYLLFADEQHTTQAVTGERLQQLLGTRPDVQLVVLNACHGASVVASGPAIQLVYSGIPYVVAMQGEVFQPVAAIFARFFYAALQAGHSVDQAVAKARLGIATDAPGAIDWSLPTLYTSVGVEEETLVTQMGNQVERWIMQPQWQRQVGGASIGVGGAHLLAAGLLVISNASPPLLSLGVATWVSVVMAAVPPFLALGVYLSKRVILPEPLRDQPKIDAMLLLRMVGAAVLGFGLTLIFIWGVVLLLAGLGFWGLLTPVAQTILLTLLFLPGFVVAWQEAIGHGHGLVSNVRIAAPENWWEELIPTLGGYILCFAPLIGMWLQPNYVEPPMGNIVVGVFLIGIGYLLRKQSAQQPVVHPMDSNTV